MKNFIFVIHKEKIYAYVLSICTILTLFFMSNFISNNFDETEITSSNIVTNDIVENQITGIIVPNEENEINNIVQ